MSNDQQVTDRTRVQRFLYTSHLLSAWNDRVFEFGSVLFLAYRYPGTLLPVSLFAMARYAPFLLFSSKIGRYIHNSERLRLMLNSIIGQRLAIIAFCLLFLFTDKGSNLFLAICSSLGCVENIFSNINTIAIERDWVVVIAASDTSFRSVLNSRMRSIDLFCKLVGPAIIGFLSAQGDSFGIIAMLAMSLISVAMEYQTVSWVYGMVPGLSVHYDAHNERTTVDERSPEKDYWHHPMLLPSLSLVFLYLTVLSFGGQFVTFLLDKGISEAAVTALRTSSVAVELAAITTVIPKFMQRKGPRIAGLAFVHLEFWVLLLAFIWFWYSNDSYGLVLGVIISRIGLWGIDQCDTLIIQENLAENERGSFSSTEKALQNLASILVYASTAVFSRPNEFLWPVALSTGSVGIATVLYSLWFFNSRPIEL